MSTWPNETADELYPDELSKARMLRHVAAFAKWARDEKGKDVAKESPEETDALMGLYLLQGLDVDLPWSERQQIARSKIFADDLREQERCTYWLDWALDKASDEPAVEPSDCVACVEGGDIPRQEN
jgi:hypothetical protein